MELQSKLQDIRNPGNIIQLLLREMDLEGDLESSNGKVNVVGEPAKSDLPNGICTTSSTFVIGRNCRY